MMERPARVVAAAIAIVALLTVGGCAPPDAAEVARQRLSDGGLEVGSSWVLVSGTVDGEPMRLLSDRPISLERVEVGIEGQSSCNRYSSDPVEGEPDTGLLFPSLVSEGMSCAGPDQTISESPIMVLEERYLDALWASTQIDATTDRLRTRGPESTLVYEPEAPA